MTAEQILGLVITLLVMLIGVVGAVLPMLPSTPIILVSALGHRLYFGEYGAATWVLVVLAIITAFSFFIDFLASIFGAHKLGATRKGIFGAFVGAVGGLFFMPLGIIIGPFLGAILFELIGGRHVHHAARAGFGAALGVLAGAVGKLAASMAMIGLFTANVIYRSIL